MSSVLTVILFILLVISIINNYVMYKKTYVQKSVDQTIESLPPNIGYSQYIVLYSKLKQYQNCDKSHKTIPADEPYIKKVISDTMTNFQKQFPADCVIYGSHNAVLSFDVGNRYEAVTKLLGPSVSANKEVPE